LVSLLANHVEACFLSSLHFDLQTDVLCQLRLVHQQLRFDNADMCCKAVCCFARLLCLPMLHFLFSNLLYLCRALKRKINGTSQDFWKEWVDVKGEYTDKGYVDKAQGVVGLPFLVAVVLGVFGALAYVVSQTSAPPLV